MTEPAKQERKSLLRATKPESWIAVIQWAQHFPNEGDWASWKAFILPLLRTCIDAGLDEHFRVGQSMSHIIVSTADKHGLENYDPIPLRVTIGRKDESGRWYIARSYTNLWLHEPDREDFVTTETAFVVLKSYLSDLWIETQPGEALPPALEAI